MARKTHTAEQIINKLREAEIHINQGMPIAEASRKVGIVVNQRNGRYLPLIIDPLTNPPLCAIIIP